MKVLKALSIGILMLTLAVGPVYSASNGKGEGKGKGREEKTNHRADPLTRGKGNKKGLLRRRAIDRDREQLDAREYLPEEPGPIIEEGTILINFILIDLREALFELENARWSYNPHDERGQGNMGEVDMLAPYGHDKDSDRMELYGNRGRVIRAVEPEPEPTPEPDPQPTPEPEPEPEPVPEPPF